MDSRVYECLLQIRNGVKREIIDKLIDYQKQGIDVMESITEKGLYLEASDYEDIKKAIFDFKQGRPATLNPSKIKPNFGLEPKREMPIVLAPKVSISEITPAPVVVMPVINTPAASGTISKKK